jgi:hypothetical protein
MNLFIRCLNEELKIFFFVYYNCKDNPSCCFFLKKTIVIIFAIVVHTQKNPLVYLEYFQDVSDAQRGQCRRFFENVNGCLDGTLEEPCRDVLVDGVFFPCLERKEQ